MMRKMLAVALFSAALGGTAFAQQSPEYFHYGTHAQQPFGDPDSHDRVMSELMGGPYADYGDEPQRPLTPADGALAGVERSHGHP